MINTYQYPKTPVLILCFLIFSFCLPSCGSGSEEETGTDPDETENPDTGNKMSLNIATYNLRREGAEDSNDRLWIARKEYAANIIQKYNFDIFGTQELEKSQINDLLELLKNNYTYIGVGRDDGVSEGEHTAILYKTTKFEVLNKGDFWLSETPDQPSWGWNASKRRVCSWAKFKEKETGTIFFFMNTHYDTSGGTNRLESSKLVLKKINEIAGDVTIFFTGDLNALPSEESIKLLTSSGKLFDSRVISKYTVSGTEGTAHGFNLDGTTTQRIDYIFVSETIKVLEYQVINDDIQLGKFSSDHFPVRIKAELEY
jgi:endonuclease/exonuclease/phosphatase family metal-dependent hydrolase